MKLNERISNLNSLHLPIDLTLAQAGLSAPFSLFQIPPCDLDGSETVDWDLNRRLAWKMAEALYNDLTWLIEHVGGYGSSSLASLITKDKWNLWAGAENRVLKQELTGQDVAWNTACTLIVQVANLLRQKSDPDKIGAAALAMWVLNDLLMSIDDSSIWRIGDFTKKGHCFGSLASALFIWIRESGGHTRSIKSFNQVTYRSQGYTDSDGSWAVGPYTFRTRNEYLEQVLRWLIGSAQPELFTERGQITHAGLVSCASLPLWQQYYLVVLTHRLRNRSNQLSTWAQLHPLEDFSRGVRSILISSRFSSRVIETYMGNLNRMNIPGAVIQDKNRALSNPYYQEYTNLLRAVPNLQPRSRDQLRTQAKKPTTAGGQNPLKYVPEAFVEVTPFGLLGLYEDARSAINWFLPN